MAKAPQSTARRGISRPVVYTALAALCIYTYVALTDPGPAARHARRIVITRSAAASDFTAEDLTARFPRYTGGKRDPFVPVVQVKVANPAQSAGGSWALTGINSIDGVANALVENSATGESAFLKTGDRWHGLRVAAIDQDAVVFENALGQKTRLSFPSVDSPSNQGPSTNTATTAPDARLGLAPMLPNFVISERTPPPPSLPGSESGGMGQSPGNAPPDGQGSGNPQ